MHLLILISGLLALVLPRATEPTGDHYRIARSTITFVSEAPLERITATNRAATGLLDVGERTFALRVPMVDFQGFNAPLQREHFNENYMGSRLWPNAVFKGRIIEAVDLTRPGTHAVRAKGSLTIRGVEHERIVPCDLVVNADGVRVTARFDVALSDHEIRIPRVVEQKIAAVVQVDADVLFQPGSATP